MEEDIYFMRECIAQAQKATEATPITKAKCKR